MGGKLFTLFKTAVVFLTPKIIFFLSGANMKATRTPCAWFLVQKEPRLPMSLIVHYCFASSSSSPTEEEENVCLFHPPSFQFFTDSSLCVCCKTLATEVNIHDFGVFPTECFHYSAHDSTIDNFVALLHFQHTVRDAIQVRGRSEPQQTPLYHGLDINFAIQCRAQIFLLLLKSVLDVTHSWSTKAPAQTQFVQSIMDIRRFLR